MIFGIGSHIPEKEAIDLPVRTLYVASKVEDRPSLDCKFQTWNEAVDCANKRAQQNDCLYAVYEVKIVGVSSPNGSTYRNYQ